MSSTKEQNNPESKIVRFFHKKCIMRGANILTACSGGPDSTCLLHSLAGLREEWELVLSCAYLDHGMREKNVTQKERDFVENQAKLLNVSFFSDFLPVGECKRIAKSTGQSLEETARKARYRFLNAIADQIKADYVAMGHTLDDQIETLIMRFFQGVDFTGLAGIPPRNGRFIRPLLACSKKEVENYLVSRNIGFLIDMSNMREEFLRNRVRNRVLPLIGEIFPGYRNSLSALSCKMTDLKGYLENEVCQRAKWERIDYGGRVRYRIRGIDFLSLPGIIRIQSLFRLCNILLRKDGESFDARIPYRFLSKVLKDSWFYPKRQLLKGHGVRFLWKNEYLFFERDVVSSGKKGYLRVINGDCRFSIAGIDMIASAVKGDKIPDESITIAEVNINYPLLVRSRRAGDRIHIISGRKSLKKLFNEWQVPEEKRWMIPIVADKESVLAVMGENFGYKNKYSQKCKKNTHRSVSTVTIKIV
jgi:tRNA(Ile)-lysidine synthase